MSARKKSPQDLNDSNNPEDANAEQGGVSTSVGQLMRGVETPMNRPKMEFRNMPISNCQYLGKVFQNLQKEVWNNGEVSQIWN